MYLRAKHEVCTYAHEQLTAYSTFAPVFAHRAPEQDHAGAAALAPIPDSAAVATSTSCGTVPPLTPTPPISLPSE